MSKNNPRDKYADRFETGETAKSEETDESSGPSENEQRSEKDQNDEKEGNAWNEGNVKQDWNGWTVYLPDELDEPFEDEYNRLQYVLDRGIKKDRHYKPLMVALALDRLEDMESEDITTFLERMERRELSIFEE